MAFDFSALRRILEEAFDCIESDVVEGQVDRHRVDSIETSLDALFRSKTQAFREVLVGCVLARLADRTLDIRKPYVDQGEGAYSARSLDERVVNPFFQSRRIPSTRGPFLSVFRRQSRFDDSFRPSVRDPKTYDAFLRVIDHVEMTGDDAGLMQVLSALLTRFHALRESSRVPLNRLQRFNQEQYASLIDRLLGHPSGGRFPVVLISAMLHALKDKFATDWVIEVQGINVADRASGAHGDIVVRSGDRIVLAAEVTERRVDRSRVVATFNTKIGPAGLGDYVFFVQPAPEEDARRQVARYFSQGHEISFLDMRDWLLMMLPTIGREGREAFNRRILEELDAPQVPQALRVAWNDHTSAVIEGDLSLGE